jgi:hypothetical protein
MLHDLTHLCWVHFDYAQLFVERVAVPVVIGEAEVFPFGGLIAAADFGWTVNASARY